MRVTLTGATGTIGHALAQALVARGDEVTALTRDPERAAGRLPGASRHGARRRVAGRRQDFVNVAAAGARRGAARALTVS